MINTKHYDDKIFLPVAFIGVNIYGMGVAAKILIVACLLFGVASNAANCAKLNRKFMSAKVIALCFFIICAYIPVAIQYKVATPSAYLTDTQFYFYTVLLVLYFSGLTDDSVNACSFLLRFIFWLKLSLATYCVAAIIYLNIGGSLWAEDLEGTVRFQTALGPSASAIFYLALMIPLMVNVLFDRKYKNVDFALVFFLLIGIFLTGTRMPLLAALLSISIAFFSVQSVTIRARFIAVAGGILVLTAFLYINFNRFFFDGGISPDSLNFSGRIGIWSSLIDGIMRAPWLGYGHGATNGYLSPLYQSPDGLGGDQAHNDFLRMLFNGGVIGACAFLLLLWSIWSGFASGGVMNHASAERRMVIICNCYFYVFILLMATDNVLVYPFFIYPFLLMAVFTARCINSRAAGFRWLRYVGRVCSM